MSSPRKIHVIFKTHLDVGFTDYARNVVAGYFERFIPQALDVAAELRARGGEARFVWTTGSWLIYEYLERAAPDGRRRMERAIADGDIAWHALPFTTHSELMDASLFRFGLSLSGELDARYGRRTIAAKMTDVPGHTRAIVPLLAEAGVRLLHIGVNPASRPPAVPPAFLWRDPAGAEVIVLYQRGSYGDLALVPGTDEALAFAHTNDNEGPQGADEIAHTFDELRARFPEAQVVASTLDAYAEYLVGAQPQLPVVTQELGDTWIHGVGTDPLKVARLRELLRLRREWLEGRGVDPDRLKAFSRRLLLVPEHTWGMDEKTHLDDYARYSAADFAQLRAEPRTRAFEDSWAEQRAYVDEALAELAASDEALAAEARARLAALAPARPSTEEMERVADPAAQQEGGRLSVALDPATGAIVGLVDTRGRRWASPDHPLALLRYERFGQADYDRFHRQYNINRRRTADWSIPDFTKPGLGGAAPAHRAWQPQLRALYRRQDAAGLRLLAQLGFPPDASEQGGSPRDFTLEIMLPADRPEAHLTLQWFEKPACRMPEALWITFNPLVGRGRWRLDKLGEPIDPLDVVRDGNRKLHAVGVGAAAEVGVRTFVLETLDAPLIAPGEPSLLNFNNRRPPLAGGVHVNLYNNVWGTNFPMWYDDDARFRFVISLQERSAR
jgi:hypothetical protein